MISIGFNPALLSFTGLQGGTTSTSFGYAYVDAAGKQDPSPATYTISWSRPLIVTFGAIEAKIEGKDLVVSWTTFVETDNDHFDIEVSKDGLSFTKIGSVNTKAPNGNSTQELKYDFTKSSTNASGLLGISILSFGLLLLCFRKRKSLVYIALFAFGIGLFGSSCGKNESALPSANTKVFVRIAQVDKDGTVDYSRIIQAIQE